MLLGVRSHTSQSGHAADRSAPARLALRLSLQSASPKARRERGWIEGPLFHLRFRLRQTFCPRPLNFYYAYYANVVISWYLSLSA
jgi:hypothetical protein